MRIARSLATAALAALAAAAPPAQAATAYLETCSPETSVTGRQIFVGVYNYAGQKFQKAFTSWCPMSIEIL